MDSLIRAFAAETVRIKEAGVTNAITGAALGAIGAGVTGNSEHMPAAMLGGAALGSGLRRNAEGALRYNIRNPLMIGALGVTGHHAAKALSNKVPQQEAAAERYANHMTQLAPPNAAYWM